MLSSKWRYLSISILFLLLVPALAACGSTSTTGGGGGATPKPGANVKVGLVTDIGGLNDKGFNHLAFLGLQKAETDLGVQGAVKESHSDSDYVPNLTGFATGGYNLVIAVGFLMQTAVGTVSQQFPNVKFAIIDGDPTDAQGNTVQRANVVGLHFKEQEAGALVGVISGMLEKAHQTKGTANTISAVGGISIPPVNHYIAGYKWAATMEDPGVKVLVGYSNDFTDPTKCAGVANSQIAAGSDIVFQVAGGCGLGAIQAADAKGVFSIGVDTDQTSSGKNVIASAVKRVDTAAFTAIKEVVDGSFQAGTQSFDLKNDGVGYAPGSLTLSPDIQAEVTKVEGEIKAGTVTVPDTIPA
ncbi:MAG TPA: BMP family ABC transporter substrate-binding protein [Ktedonobacterales bacterium]|nr:BMP family ABC transporter substrate-binding protein [Ktedonobacterales bacterium]